MASREELNQLNHSLEIHLGDTMMIPLIKATLYISAIYSIIAFIIYLRQDTFIFFPNSAKHTLSQNASAIEEYSITQGDITLQGWLVNPHHCKSDLIIYYGGNAEDVFHNIEDFLELDGVATLLVNYRGYGSSGGKPSEAHLFGDAISIYEDIKKRYNPARIHLMGRSLGSGVATYVGSQKRVQGIILVTPFDSLVHMARSMFPWLPTSLLLKHPFNSLQYISQIDHPVLVIYAGKDSVIPNKRTKNLIKHIGADKEIHMLEEADHNNISLFPTFWLHIVSFIDRTAHTPSLPRSKS